MPFLAPNLISIWKARTRNKIKKCSEISSYLCHRQGLRFTLSTEWIVMFPGSAQLSVAWSMYCKPWIAGQSLGNEAIVISVSVYMNLAARTCRRLGLCRSYRVLTQHFPFVSEICVMMGSCFPRLTSFYNYKYACARLVYEKVVGPKPNHLLQACNPSVNCFKYTCPVCYAESKVTLDLQRYDKRHNQVLYRQWPTRSSAFLHLHDCRSV